MPYTIEIAANNLQSALAAASAGANRIELVSNLAEGGTTPSLGTFMQCVQEISIPVFPIIRSRGGDFCYSNAEISSMQKDIAFFRDAGCKGIVIGALNADKTIDSHTCKKWISTAQGMEITFHRAFDRCINPSEAIKQIIDLGCHRILTSGQCADAFEGRNTIAAWQNNFGNQIIFLPGAGITNKNALDILQSTGCKEIHTSAKTNKNGFIESDSNIITEFIQSISS